jgi:hypothetical protein
MMSDDLKSHALNDCLKGLKGRATTAQDEQDYATSSSA